MLALGFMVDWVEANKHLTGNDYIDDSGPVEAYAKTLGLYCEILDGDAFFGVILDEFNADWEQGDLYTLPLASTEKLAARAEEIKNKLLTTGMSLDTSEAVLVSRSFN